MKDNILLNKNLTDAIDRQDFDGIKTCLDEILKNYSENEIDVPLKIARRVALLFKLDPKTDGAITRSERQIAMEYCFSYVAGLAKNKMREGLILEELLDGCISYKSRDGVSLVLEMGAYQTDRAVPECIVENAIWAGDEDVLIEILKAGADIKSGGVPIWFNAILSGNLHLLNTLFEYGARMDQLGGGETALDMLVKFTKNLLDKDKSDLKAVEIAMEYMMKHMTLEQIDLAKKRWINSSEHACGRAALLTQITQREADALTAQTLAAQSPVSRHRL